MQSERNPAKWILAIVGGLFVLVAGTAGLLWYKFTPLVQIDQKEQKIRLLGGAIQIDGSKGQMQVGSKVIQGQPTTTRTFEGTAKIRSAAKAAFDISFPAGSAVFRTSKDAGEFRWKCKVSSSTTKEPEVRQKGDDLTLDLSKITGGSCMFEVPAGASVKLSGISGVVSLDEPRFSADIELQTGQVGMKPAPGQKYRFKPQVMAGVTDPYFTKDDGGPDAPLIELRVMAGAVTKE